MARVVNRHAHVAAPDDIYIGRGTKYGNPYTVDAHGMQAMVLYLEYFLRRFDDDRCVYGASNWIAALWSLRGHVLVCSCAPRPCHGDAIVSWIHAVDYRLGMQGRFSATAPTDEATKSGIIAVELMASFYRQPPAQGLLFSSNTKGPRGP